jgi:tRNA (guanine37-N1)-methyltransferase
MRIDIITLFPYLVTHMASESILKRAQEKGKFELVVHNLRDQAVDSYGSVDGHPYGGGPGMVLRVDVVVLAIAAARKLNPGAPVILTTPQGVPYAQHKAVSLAQESGLIIVCGHYEGYDERIRSYVDQEISIGDYVLTGGELPAMIITDSVIRLLPGVLGDDTSSHEESFSDGRLEYPQYTRPETYDGKSVPEVLLSGNHKVIDAWRAEQSQKKTKLKRPDLLSK